MFVVNLVDADLHHQGSMIFDSDKGRTLPYLFVSESQAERFLEAAERVGTNLYPSMSADDLTALVTLWLDAWKRAPEPVSAGL